MFRGQRFDGAGVSLADPASSGMPGLMRGDFGIYSVVEQKLYRFGADDDRGIGVFARASYSPPDRNLIDYYADTGLEFVGLADSRPKDKFGIAAAYAHVSPRAQALDFEFQRLTCPAGPCALPKLVTAVYQYEVRAGWTLQPNFQFIVRPGGGTTNPLSTLPGKVLKNAESIGLRTVLKF